MLPTRRQLKLGLSRVSLGRILDVDPATIFRRERGPLAALWDYAMRGIEAEAASEKAKRHIRGDKAQLKVPSIADMLDAQGFAFTAEKMNQARRQHAQEKVGASRKRLAERSSGLLREQSGGQSAATKLLADKYIADPSDKK